MISSSLPHPSGNMPVVTQMVPMNPNGNQQLNSKHRFRKGQPKALGTIQIMIGLITLLYGIADLVGGLQFHMRSMTVGTGIFVWGALFYIISGSLTVAAGKSLNRCLINGSLGLNIIATLVAVFGFTLSILNNFLMFSMDYQATFPGYIYVAYWAMGTVFHFMEFIISITAAAFACNASCDCCSEKPRVAPPKTQLHYHNAYAAPAQPYLQTGPSFRNPQGVGSNMPR
ncbi:unnamed protein product [Ophioblennius macclurei]